MTMYTIADTSVTEDEFRRAAKVCIGKSLDEAVVNTVFHIFDTDGEHCMNYDVILHCINFLVFLGR